ncbi:MAG: bifunctional riboflavin kinase/FAD synthetase [Acidimicrobiia bacterium]|nr:MAG: bifunctional riboflavin kinase/FAD synthetase [Acidimicrobiia bacterium]
MFNGRPESWNPDDEPHAVAIGVFDGAHRGHRAVFQSLSEAGGDLPTVALTFGTHPDAVVSGDPGPPALASLDRRLDQFASEGFDAVAVIDFTHEVRNMSPVQFVDAYLIDGLNAKVVAVGAGFCFGFGAEGTVDTLRILGQSRGFSVIETPIVDLYGTEVRSSAIRAAIASGAVELAARLLGRPFSIDGTVVPGDARGKTIGFPTANITMPEGLVRPASGVYAVFCTVDSVEYNAVCNVGTRPTFGGGPETIEVHLLDVEVDLYDKEMRVAFIDRIRNEQHFASVDALVAQIKADIEQARIVLAVG